MVLNFWNGLPTKVYKYSNSSYLISKATSQLKYHHYSTILNPLSLPPSSSTFPSYEKKEFFQYDIIYQSKKSNARVGRITTPHGIIDTPGFVAVGTNGALKGVDQRQADEAGLQLMFSNTYHLLLQPGPELIQKAGGLHQFINRKRPLITDSGGFQIFSLAYGSVHDELTMKSQANKGKFRSQPSVTKITEDGVLFKSFIDGKMIQLTPESSVQAQKAYGADIIIPLDELPPYHITQEKLIESLYRTHRWEARSLKEHLKDIRQQAMYGVLHGGIDPKLRQFSIEYLTSLPFDGYAIGGSVGKNREEMMILLKTILPMLPYEKPNHLLGIADPISIINCIPLGIDTFDSCYPTRCGRHGTLFSKQFGRISIKKRKWSQYFQPIDEKCTCPFCSQHTLAYLHHLFKANEPSAMMFATIHNLYYMCNLMKELRESILNGEI